jgi:hypothetical protein
MNATLLNLNCGVNSYRTTKCTTQIRDSIVASIPACHAGDQGSIPCRGASFTLRTIVGLTIQVTFAGEKLSWAHLHMSLSGNACLAI